MVTSSPWNSIDGGREGSGRKEAKWLSSCTWGNSRPIFGLLETLKVRNTGCSCHIGKEKSIANEAIWQRLTYMWKSKECNIYHTKYMPAATIPVGCGHQLQSVIGAWPEPPDSILIVSAWGKPRVPMDIPPWIHLRALRIISKWWTNSPKHVLPIRCNMSVVGLHITSVTLVGTNWNYLHLGPSLRFWYNDRRYNKSHWWTHEVHQPAFQYRHTELVRSSVKIMWTALP